MASIRKRTRKTGEISYQAMVRLKGFPPQTASFRRLTDARIWIASTESAIREGRHFKTSESKKHTLSEMFDRYIEQVTPRKKNRRNDERHLNWWRNEIGSYSLSEVSQSIIVDGRDKLLHSGRSHSTANRYITSLSHAFTVAINEWNWLEVNPCGKIKKLNEPRGRTRYLSMSERSLLLNECAKSKSPDLYDAVVLSLATGGRQREILSLTWNQINLTRRTITLFETKNNEIRILPISEFALDVLNCRLLSRRFDTDLVFPSRKNSEKPIEVRSAFEKALHRADIEDFRWHDLRHTTASYLAMNGASLAEIAEVLGHKTLAMVKRYAHLSEAHTAKVVESMNQMLFRDVN